MSRETRRLTGILWALVCLTAWAAICIPGGVAAEAGLEYQVKAAFLLNFAKFVDWPQEAFASATSPIAICVVGNDPFGKDIDNLVQGESASGRKLMVRRITGAPEPLACQIIFTQESGKGVSGILEVWAGVFSQWEKAPISFGMAG